MFKVVLSPLTNRIYCGKSGRGTPNTLTGKEDVTMMPYAPFSGGLYRTMNMQSRARNLLSKSPIPITRLL